MNYMADGGGPALTKDELIDVIHRTLDSCHTVARQGTNLPAVSRASFGGAETAEVLGFHTGAAHNHVVEAMTELAAGFLAFDQSVGKFRRDVQDTDETVSQPFRKAIQGMDANDLLSAGQSCTVGNTPDDYADNSQCTLPSTGGDQ